MSDTSSIVIEDEITRVEEQLRQAMLTSDVAMLDRLIANDLLFTSHLGQRVTKTDDLAIHRSGMLRFGSLEPSEQVLKVVGSLVVASVRMRATGVYHNESFSSDLRYTRLWRKSEDGQWQVCAGHSSLIQG